MSVGSWGEDPWDNDAAADWFAILFDRTQLADRVVEGLNDARDLAAWLVHLAEQRTAGAFNATS